MAFGRRNRLGTQINSVKHIIDSEGALSGGAISTTPIGTAVTVRSAVFNPEELALGENVNGFFISVFIIGATGAPLNGSIDWYIAKLRGGQTIGDLPAPNNAGISELRNQIFHQEKGLAGSGDGTPMAFKGVIAVPKGMRRTRSGDQYVIALSSGDATNDATFCIKAIYKSFS